MQLETAGKVIEIRPLTISIGNIDDEFQADRILEWLKQEINAAWQRRNRISPRHQGWLNKDFN